MEQKIILGYPAIFTFLAFCINAIIDKGKFIPYNEMTMHIEQRTVWDLLEKQATNPIWLKFYSEQQRKELMDYFDRSLNAINAEDKYGITKNGYCLLLSYLIEAVQSGEDSGWFPSLK
jgi:hypothetical protein